MDFHDLREWVEAEPFRPFRLRLTNGRTYEITHPTLIWPSRRTVMIGMPDNPAEPDVPGDHVTVALIHVTELEPLERVAAN